MIYLIWFLSECYGYISIDVRSIRLAADEWIANIRGVIPFVTKSSKNLDAFGYCVVPVHPYFILSTPFIIRVWHVHMKMHSMIIIYSSVKRLFAVWTVVLTDAMRMLNSNFIFEFIYWNNSINSISTWTKLIEFSSIPIIIYQMAQ